jgi:UDP-glucose 4-epimerase
LIEDTSPYNLFPIILNSWEKGNSPAITGSDFMTKDGTAIRDYIHVSDIVSAHLACIKRMESGTTLSNVFNLSLNVGVSVLEIMNKFKTVLGDNFNFGFTERRIGDPAEIYGSSARASKELGWSGNFSLDEMVKSAVEARKNTLKSVQPYQQSARSDLGMQQSQFE